MYVLQVDGMTCGGCASRVKKSIQAVDGAATIEIDVASRKVQIDTDVDIEAVKTAIAEAGYPVTSTTAR